jgi:hypothetical protein
MAKPVNAVQGKQGFQKTGLKPVNPTAAALAASPATDEASTPQVDAVASTHAAYRASVVENAKAYADENFVSIPDEVWEQQGRALDENEPTGTVAWGRTSPAPARNGYQFAPDGECSYCDTEYARGNSFFPPHRTERKPNCGGGDNFHHCTCGACF